MWQNLAYPPNISKCTGSIFTKFSQLLEVGMGMIKTAFTLQSSKGHCQLIVRGK